WRQLTRRPASFLSRRYRSPVGSCRNRRVLPQQPFLLQFAPEPSRNLLLHEHRIALSLGARAGAGNDVADGRMREGKLQGGRRQGDTVLLAGLLDRRDTLPDRLRCRQIIVARLRNGAGRQDAGIEGRAQNDRDTFLDTTWQEAIERILFQQRIAPGQQEAVEA